MEMSLVNLGVLKQEETKQKRFETQLTSSKKLE
jgi:hypothetical protein